MNFIGINAYDTNCLPSAACCSRSMENFEFELAKNITFLNKLKVKLARNGCQVHHGQTMIHGWKAFCKMKDVKKDDLCKYKFPEREGKKHDIIEVEIIRGLGSRREAKTKSN